MTNCSLTLDIIWKICTIFSMQHKQESRKMDCTAIQWEVVACALRSKFGNESEHVQLLTADSNVEEYLLSGCP